MIEFYGWTFDFKKMRAIDHNGQRFMLMKLNNEFYVQHESAKEKAALGMYKPSWNWPSFRIKEDPETGLNLDGWNKQKNKELTQVYMTWCVEEAIFGPAEGR